MTTYGIEFSQEDRDRMEDDLLKYLEAIINAEKLNPDEDYDQSRYIRLLKKVALSDLPWNKRSSLVLLLDGGYDDENNY